jgi:hypothetical protein
MWAAGWSRGERLEKFIDRGQCTHLVGDARGARIGRVAEDGLDRGRGALPSALPPGARAGARRALA